MPSGSTLLAFLVAVVAMQLVPGPDTMLVVGRAIGQGRRIALWSVFGAIWAAVVQLPVLAFGAGAVLLASPLAFELLRHAGALFLIFLGLRLLWRAGRTGAKSASPPPSFSATRAFWEGLTVSLTNPNVFVFMLALLPQFVDPARGSPVLQLFVLGVVQKTTGLAILGATALAAGRAGDWIARRPRWAAWQARFAGALMLALGLRMLLGGGGPAAPAAASAAR
jgi:threonine/homoserine/homoserine lactone efflux protein